ncbi:hypothetical protein H2248_010766 [Termitomyces sp. 'cryptogamus']|nr:hypothetical protein H2248_010766 [Termitomyces sp. 'cryptogamus']
MECLDSSYASLKRDTKDPFKTPEEKAMPDKLRFYRPISTRSDRFAKPTIWENARRHFYWAVRARIAKSAALVDIAEASPNSTVECRIQSLDSLVQIDSKPEYRKIAEALEKLDLSQTIIQLKVGHFLHRRSN